MAELPSVSVVTVSRNDLRRLRLTVKNILDQTAANIELLIIDGASDDGTREWLSSVSDPRVTSVSEPDNGIFDAMRKGAEMARGDLLVFMNAGDSYRGSDVLAKAVSQVADAHKDWGYGRAALIDEESGEVRRIIGNVPYSPRRHKYGRAVICHQAVLMRRDLYLRLGGFDLRFGLAADYHLLLRAAKECTPSSWPSVDVNYEGGGVSAQVVYAQLWRRHRARVDAARLMGPAVILDSAFTAAQTIQIWMRKAARRVTRRVPPIKPT